MADLTVPDDEAARETARKARQAAYHRDYHKRNKDRQKARANQRRVECPEQIKAIKRAYREKHKDQIRAQKKRWKAANRDHVNAKNAVYSQTTQAKSTKQAWRIANKQQIRHGKKEWRERNKERIEAYIARWRIENREQVRLHTKTAFANRRAAGAGKINPRDLRAIFTAQRGRCAICREKLVKYEADHIVPLKLGGSNLPRNIQLTCRSCNASKNAKDPIDFMQERGFLL